MSKNYLLTIVLIVTSILSSSAQEEKPVFQYDSNGNICSAVFPKSENRNDFPNSPESFFNDILKINPSNSFRKNEKIRLREGNETYEQYYKGIKIEDAGYTFHYDQDGNIISGYGDYADIEDFDVTPSISQEEVRDLFLKYKNVDIQDIKGYNADLVIIRISDTENNKKEPVLVYKIRLDVTNQCNDEIGYINAHNGEIVSVRSTFSRSSSNGYFNTLYNGYKYASTDYTGSYYYLYDNSRNVIIHTKTLNDTNYPTDTEIKDYDNSWYQSEHGLNAMAFDVHWAVQKIFDRLKNVHSINSYDNNGSRILSYVRALINGYFDNAECIFDINGNVTLKFGNGTNHGHPYSTLDIVAHEYGHAITHAMIGWDPTDPSSSNGYNIQGSLDEGLSDVWAAIMEYRFGPTTNDVWKMGEQLFDSGATNDCIRNIAEPNSSTAETPIAGTYLSSFYNNTNVNGNMLKYRRSGVFSHWFYLLVNGGQGTNDNGQYYKLSGIGMDQAENLVVKAVYEGYLLNHNTYLSVRDGFASAARDLGGESLEAAVCNAWYAVGVGEMYLPIVGATVPCGSSVYQVNYLPSGSSVTWSLPGFSSLLTPNSPSVNKCIINNSSHQYINTTLSALVYVDGHLVKTSTKQINTGANFAGTMTGTYVGFLPYNQLTPPDIPLTNIGNEGYYNVSGGYKLFLSSDYFINATVTYSGSAVNSWSNPGQGVITCKLNNTHSSSNVIISGVKGCNVYKFTIHVTPNMQSSLNISSSDRLYTISIISDIDDNNDVNESELIWDLSVYNALTGEKIYDQHIVGYSQVTIDTSRWTPGVYIIKATIGNEEYTEKITVK